MLTEINFDGIIGPTHNYAGLSIGNLAATANAGTTAYPRDAALQSLSKMRQNLSLGLAQGFLLPLARPNTAFLEALGADEQTDHLLTAAAWSASSMWTANAATVSPSPDTADGKCHLTPANLVTMPHRAQEWPGTARQLAIAFSDTTHFVLHPPIPPSFGDEGAANHMRLAENHSAPGLEIFVYGGLPGGPFPARQHEQASRAVARLHRLHPARTIFTEQAPDAIAAGAFHNDVVAVANEQVLFAHERAFADPDALFAEIREKLPTAEIVVVPDSAVDLPTAIRTYLFNAQLVSAPGTAGMTLIVPTEAWASESVRAYLDELVRGNGAIRHVLPVDVRQSMANGGGPACLRLRVVADPATIDPRFLLTDATADQIERVITAHWPEQIETAELGNELLRRTVIAARVKLREALDLAELA